MVEAPRVATVELELCPMGEQSLARPMMIQIYLYAKISLCILAPLQPLPGFLFIKIRRSLQDASFLHRDINGQTQPTKVSNLSKLSILNFIDSPDHQKRS